MTREWQPGDVAMVTLADGREVVAMREIGDKWNGVGRDEHGAFGVEIGNVPPMWVALTIRPLAVIDPEDADRIERLIDLLDKQWDGPPAETTDEDRLALTAALREFADPKPPKPTVLAHITSAPVNGIVQALCGKTFKPHEPDEVVVEGNCATCATRATGWVS